MKQGMYTITKELLKEIKNNYVFDFEVNFEEFDTLVVGGNTLEFYKEPKFEEVWTDKDREYIETPGKRVYYKRNEVSGCYCRIYM